MKRTDITELFPEATKEQIDRLMGINGADVNAARGELETIRTQLASAQAGADDLKAAQDRAAELQQELDGMKAAEALRLMREKVSGEHGIPMKLLTGTTEEECVAQAKAIGEYAASQKPPYPALRDGGETHVEAKKTTAEQFAEWFEQIRT